MAIDFERLDAAIDWAVEHPDEFDYAVFFGRTDCGTTACLTRASNRPGRRSCRREKDGDVRYAKDVAAEVVGLDNAQATSLFIGAGGLRGAIDVRNQLAAAARVPGRFWTVSA